MNSHSKIRVVSSILLSATLIAWGGTSASFAATTATPKPTTTAKATPKIAKPTTTAGNRGGRFANLTTVQKACLVKHGVTIPTSTSNATRPAGGFGAGGFNSAKTQASFKACGVKAPTGGFGGGTFNSVKFQAFQKCMTKAGFTSTGFGRYDQSDPSTVAALVKCQKSTGFTLPKAGQPGSNN